MTQSMDDELRKFVVPEIVFGIGALEVTGRYMKNLGARKVLVVTDPGVVAAGWAGEVVKSLEREGVDYTVFSHVTPNPRAEEVMAGAEIFSEQDCNAILAVGGGSPMDCAKGIGIVSSNGRHILEFEGVDMVSVPGPPLVCIPTTAGSSADVSQFAIITDMAKKVKIAIISKTVVPDVAIIDPRTTTTMDEDLTANTGMDALSHAVEAHVSNASSSITDIHAIRAIELIRDNLLPVLQQPLDLEIRKNMMLASMHAGMAFSNASLGVVHAMAHSLGGLLDTPHGETNAILLWHVINYNFDAAPEKYRQIAHAMGLETRPETCKQALLDAVDKLRETSCVRDCLGPLGVGKADIAQLAENAMNDACMVTNPRRPTLAELEALYDKAL